MFTALEECFQPPARINIDPIYVQAASISSLDIDDTERAYGRDKEDMMDLIMPQWSSRSHRALRKAPYSTSRPTAPPPQPRPWKSTPAGERIVKHPKDLPIEAQPEPPAPTLMGRIFGSSSSSGSNKAIPKEPTDMQRGIEAAQRVIMTGKLDARYRPAARRVTAIICATPVAVYLTYELFQRRFMGKQQKTRPVVSSEEVVIAEAPAGT